MAIKKQVILMQIFFSAIFLVFQIDAQSAPDPGIISRTYGWEYLGRQYHMDLELNSNSYKLARSKPRTYDDYYVYVSKSRREPVLLELVASFRKLARTYNMNDWELVNLVLSFVQQLDYMAEKGAEYPKFPVETLVDGGGDCEDTAILLVALLESLDIKALLVSTETHMAAGICVYGMIGGVYYPFNGENYYYTETTQPGWSIGEFPDNVGKKARLMSRMAYTAAR